MNFVEETLNMALPWKHFQKIPKLQL